MNVAGTRLSIPACILMMMVTSAGVAESVLKSVKPDFEKYCQTHHPGSVFTRHRLTLEPLCTEKDDTLTATHYRIAVGRACLASVGTRAFRRSTPGNYVCMSGAAGTDVNGTANRSGLDQAGRIETIHRQITELNRMKVYVWTDSNTGQTIKQKKFRKLKAPFEYQGEMFAAEGVAADIARLEKEIETLRKQVANRHRAVDHKLPPLEAPEANGTVSAIRLLKRRDDGSFEVYHQARVSMGPTGSARVHARKIHEDVRDLKPELPRKVKRQLVSNYRVPTWLELRLVKPPASGTQRLEGNDWSLHVSYNAYSHKVSRIHTPYAEKLILTRPGIQTAEGAADGERP